jgi:hypothetical protein
MNFIANIIDDCLSVKGVPTATAGAVLSRVMGKRHQVLREVIASEFRQGNFDRADEDEIVSICYRLIRDAEEGVAKNNLRLMARVINGMAEKNELRAPTFLKYANILASLTEDEITVLGIMMKYATTPHHKGMFSPDPDKHPLEHSDPEKDELKNFVKNYAAVQQALVRTGLIYFSVNAEAGNDFVLDGGTFSDPNSGGLQMTINSKVQYQITPLAREIYSYVDQIIQKEAA